MRPFICKIIFFLVPLLLLSLPIDYGISHLLRQSNSVDGEYEEWTDIYDSKINCDIAIYGSSKAWVEINPKILKDTLNMTAYNFGIDGHNFWLQYLRHIEFLKYNKKPKQIVFSIDIFTLQKRADLYKLDQFLPYMLWNKDITEYTKSYKGYKPIDYYLPLIRYAGKRDALSAALKILIKGPSAKKTRNRGYAGVDQKWNSDFDNAKKKNKSYEVKIDPASKVLFEKFIKECRELNINLVLVCTPEYVEGQKFVSNRDEVMNMYKGFATTYNLTFIDYSSDGICLDKDLFYNANHLNKKGSVIFSKKLAHDLKSTEVNQ